MSGKTFVPKSGQVDYTGIRYCPVINCVLSHEFPEDGGERRILILKRSPDSKFYPNTWNGISGFLDDAQTFEAKVLEELREEVGIGQESVASIRRGMIFHKDAPDIGKTWIVHPVLVEVNTDRVELDREHCEARWIWYRKLCQYELLPGFGVVVEKVIKMLYS